MERVYITQGSISTDQLLRVPVKRPRRAKRIWRRAGFKSFCLPWQQRIKFADCKCKSCLECSWTVEHLSQLYIIITLQNTPKVDFYCNFTHDGEAAIWAKLSHFAKKFLKNDKLLLNIHFDSWPWIWPLHTRDKLCLPAEFHCINQLSKVKSCVRRKYIT